ncbi:MAG: Uncharacterised protein [Cellulomonadaceae bacterium TMED98]|nr:MAG: Uncharacterised protein [Cellulomonadaceae bacterium TMED98]
MNTLEALRNDGFDPEQHGALRCPISRRARAVFLTGQDHQGCLRPLVVFGRIEDEALLPGRSREVAGKPAFDAIEQQIFQANIGEGASNHHFVVSTPGAIGVEVQPVNTVALQIVAGGAIRPNGPGRGNVVGGHRIAQQ